MTKKNEATATSTEPMFSSVRVTLQTKDSLRGLASCKVNDVVFLTGLRVVDGPHGLFVSMPTRKVSPTDYQDVYFPASKAVRDELQRLVLEQYQREVELASKSSASEAAA